MLTRDLDRDDRDLARLRPQLDEVGPVDLAGGVAAAELRRLVAGGARRARNRPAAGGGLTAYLAGIMLAGFEPSSANRIAAKLEPSRSKFNGAITSPLSWPHKASALTAAPVSVGLAR